MNNNVYSFVINNIKNIISKKGMKQGFVAQKSGFTQNEFSNLMNERKLLRVEYLPPIAEALDVDINDLYKIPDDIS